MPPITPLEIVTIPCLSDNYTFLIHDSASGDTAVVDVPEAAPISAELKRRGWTLSHVLLTHHHWDHIEGLSALLAEHPARVVGAAADAHRLPPLDGALTEGEHITIGTEQAQIIDVSGHTLGHIAFYFPDTAAVFTGDSLMALGCGRLFEGSAPQMFDSLSKLAALPEVTTVYSGHEYTLANAHFALTVDPENTDLENRMSDIKAARANGLPTVPSQLALELATNPFLRGHTSGLQRAVGMEGADPAEVFAKVRSLKDAF